MSAPTFRVISLPDPLHDFLSEMLSRVVREGLLVPDELGYAAALWDRVRNAQTVTPPAAPEAEPPTPKEDAP